MIREILTEGQRALLRDERRSLDGLAEVLAPLDAGAGSRAADAAAGLDPLFVVAVLGAPPNRVAADALADALLGAARPGRDRPPEGLEMVRVSSPGDLAGLTPDLALLVTRAHDPLAGEERALLTAAAEAATRVMVVVDGVEMLRLTEDVTRMEEAVEASAERMLGRPVPAYGISTARIDGEPGTAGAGERSWIPVLARKVEAALRSPAVLAPKLRGAAKAGRELAASRREEVERRRRELAGDVADLEAVEAELAAFEERAETALGRAQAAVDGVLADYEVEAGRFIRRGTRPLRVAFARREEARFAAGPVDRAWEGLDGAVGRLDRTLRDAAKESRRAVLGRLGTGAPGSGSDLRGGAGAETVPGRGSATVSEVAGFDPRRERDAVAGGLRRAGRLAAVLLAVGALFAAAPTLGALTGSAGVGVLAVALGGGLGGAAVLGGLGLLELRRRRLTAELAERAEERRRSAAAALASRAERLTAEGRARILEPVAEPVERVRRERDRLDRAGAELGRLEGELTGLLQRVDREVGRPPEGSGAGGVP